MVHSAFGYGNETVLCNDPHALPYTSLDDAEAVEAAVKKSNISVKICRIGPWAFPVEVTTCFLPKGVDLPHQALLMQVATASTLLPAAFVSSQSLHPFCLRHCLQEQVKESLRFSAIMMGASYDGSPNLLDAR